MTDQSPNHDRNQDKSLREIEHFIREGGLVPIGIVPLEPMPEEYARFQTWLNQGRNGGMEFLNRHSHIREDPRHLLDGVQSAVIVGLLYAQGDRLPREGEVPKIAQYARLKDYHRVIRNRGEKVLAKIHAHFGVPDTTGRVVTDSAPLLERAIAASTATGFIGKNTCFISPKVGSMLLLGELLTPLKLPFSNPQRKKPLAHERTLEGGCGTCRRCQVHCPTGALDEDYRMDARKCIAYWTIEHRGTIPENFWPWLSKYIFGCDICQIVCPYNRHKNNQMPQEIIRLNETPPLFEIATMDQERYERLFGGTPMTRAKRTGLMRNALIAMAVTHHPQLNEALEFVIRTEEDAVLNATVNQIKLWIHR